MIYFVIHEYGEVLDYVFKDKLCHRAKNIICTKLEHCKAIPFHIADFEQQNSWKFLHSPEFGTQKVA